ALAKVLINNPDLLILDEPTNGLDPKGIRQIRDLILEIAAGGTTILLASHLLDEVEKVCSHVVILNKGISLYNGKVSTMNLHSGYVEIGYHDLDQLSTTAEKLGLFSKTEAVNGILKAYATSELDTSAINRAFTEQGIYLNHILYKKASLEENFLAITQNL
ncbi:MAG: ABC transporter ATP-binding protein, partial [Flavobacteriaceae bacterium]|nr:ABC transporter ATP-binding protein [Flavobacteriaceae bacterium]